MQNQTTDRSNAHSSAAGLGMMMLLLAVFLIPQSSALGQQAQGNANDGPLVLRAPEGGLQVTSQLDAQGRPIFDIVRGDVPLVSGRLGLELAGSGLLGENMRVTAVRRREHDATYEIPVGKTSSAREQYRELVVSLQDRSDPPRTLEVIWRAFPDGVAFRYHLPGPQPTDFVISDEVTQLQFAGNPTAHLLPLNGYTTSYEKYYDHVPIDEIDTETLIGLPLLLHREVEHTPPVWMAVTEAGLTDYAGMYLQRPHADATSLISRLSPLPDRADGAKVIGRTPFDSPWRVIQVADAPGRLIESNIVFHLNAPSKIADPSWIQPGKTTFPWWNHYVLEDVDFEPGVNTATMMHYIDFCAEQGIPYHSLDGLDIAWYGGPIRPSGPVDVTTAAPSIDLPHLLRYADSKGVRLRLWMHWKALEPQLDEAFAAYEEWGIEGVMIDFMDRDDQQMVRWYHEVAEKAAKHRLTVTWHGAYKPTGMERTWPNVLSYEGVLNQEYNKWQPRGVKGTPPEHNLDVAFIRMLAGPLDYHQGGMRSVLPENYRFRDVAPPVQGTRGHQLAMYIVYQNHLPMMVDYPSAYRGQPDLDFLVDIPCNWDETRVLEADFGKCLAIARRAADTWYVGGMTAEEPRTLDLPLTFAGDGRFDVELVIDDESGGPTATASLRKTLKAGDSLPVTMPASGGFVARMTPRR